MPLLPPNAQNYTLETVFTLANSVIDTMIMFATSAALVVIIWGAILYFFGSSSGEGKAQGGKAMIMWALIGMGVIILAKVIVVQVLNVLVPASPGVYQDLIK